MIGRRLKAKARVLGLPWIGPVLLSDPTRAPDIESLLHTASPHSVVIWRTFGARPTAKQARHIRIAVARRQLTLVVSVDSGLARRLNAGLYWPARWRSPEARRRISALLYQRQWQGRRLMLAGAQTALDVRRAKIGTMDGVLLSKLANSASLGAGRVLGPIKWRLRASGGQNACATLPLGGVTARTLRRIETAKPGGFAAVGRP